MGSHYQSQTALFGPKTVSPRCHRLVTALFGAEKCEKLGKAKLEIRPRSIPKSDWGLVRAWCGPGNPADVVAALAVGEDLDALDEAGGVGRGRGQRVGAVRVPDAEGDLDGLGVDEGRAAGQRDAADPRGCGGEGAQRAGEVLHVMPRRHVACVACFQLVVQALRQLILGSGGDYLHACLYTRILTRTAKENAITPVPTLM